MKKINSRDLTTMILAMILMFSIMLQSNTILIVSSDIPIPPVTSTIIDDSIEDLIYIYYAEPAEEYFDYVDVELVSLELSGMGPTLDCKITVRAGPPVDLENTVFYTLGVDENNDPEDNHMDYPYDDIDTIYTVICTPEGWSIERAKYMFGGWLVEETEAWFGVASSFPGRFSISMWIPLVELPELTEILPWKVVTDTFTIPLTFPDTGDFVPNEGLAYSREEPTVTEVTFGQINFNLNGVLTLNSDWGTINVRFYGSADIQYLNLISSGVWSIQNLPVLSIEGDGIEQTQCFWFPLDVPSGTDVTTIDYGYELTYYTVETPPVEDMSAPVGDDEYVVYNGGADVLFNTMPAVAEVLVGGAVIDPVQHKHKNFPNQEAGDDECAPTAVSNSMKFLNDKHKLDMKDADITIAKMKEATNWGTKTIASAPGPGVDRVIDPYPPTWPDPRTIKGCWIERDDNAVEGEKNAWWEDKDAYMKANNLPITTRKLEPKDIGELIAEIDRGQDIEAELNGHTVAVVGIADLGGGRHWVTIAHDKDQDVAGGTVVEGAVWNSNTKNWSGALSAYGLNYFVVECPKKVGTSKITDNTGETTFYGVFVGDNKPDLDGAEEDAREMHDLLDEANGDPYKGWKAENKELLLGAGATKDKIKEAIKKFRDKAEPGDEFIFYFSGHGSDKIRKDGEKDGDETAADPKDESNDYDNSIRVSDGSISDDELAQMLSGFKYSVTIVVILDSCYSGTFVDGGKDLKSITQTNVLEEIEVQLPVHHLEVLMASCEETSEQPYKWKDNDGDGKVDPDELTGPLKHYVNCSLVDDRNDNNKLDDGEIVPAGEVKWKGDFTYQLLKELVKDGKDKKNKDTTKADTNKDGITTAKELYDVASNELKLWYQSDSDNDGNINEDGVEHGETGNMEYHFGEDNDGDGWIDEDPSPAIEHLPTYYESGIVFSFSYPSISKTVTNDTITYLAVTVSNLSNQTQTFDVTAYSNQTLIETKTVAGLDSGDSKIVTFRWNTTLVTLGRYKITFFIPPTYIYFAGIVSEVPRGEIQPDGIINILDISVGASAFGSNTLIEDVNRDGIVDDIDVAIVLWAIGSFPGDPSWNPDADVNGDSVINQFDAASIASVFNQLSHPRWNQLTDMNVDREVNILDLAAIALVFGYQYPWP